MKKWIKGNFFVVLIGVLAIGFLFSRYVFDNKICLSPAVPVNSGLQSQVGSQWSLPDLEGNLFQSRDLDGKVAVLNFWATWCGPCLAEIPSLVYVQETYGPQGVEVVGISIDHDEEGLRRFVAEKALNYKVVIDDDFSVMSQFVNVRGVPVTIILDREGRIAKVVPGGISKYRLEQMVLKVLQSS